jgi:hypothetical protein
LTTVDRAEALGALIATWEPDSYCATEKKDSGSDLTAHTRHVAQMFGVSPSWFYQDQNNKVVFEVWWD